MSPDPPKNRQRTAATLARDEQPAAANRRGGADEFFAALGSSWRLTEAQRARLTPAVKSALGAGWTPQALALVTGANTTGVRNPYAVLAARLSPDELPVPASVLVRRPWCGECDEITRMLDYYGDAPRPCPKCKAPTTRQADKEGHSESRPYATPARPVPDAI